MARPIADGEEARAEIDARLAGLPVDQRAALEDLRRTIAAAAPDAVEAISYGAPAFRYRGRPLVMYQASARHCSFYPNSGTLLGRHVDALAGFGTSKGTVRFTPDRPLPAELVTEIVRERVAEIDAAAGDR